MSRYFTTPARAQVKALGDDDWPLLPSLTVSDHEATDTGLLDEAGNTIWRAPNPMGFIWDWPSPTNRKDRA